MKVYGVTGGIGSGKTTVCKIFESLKIPVFYADRVGGLLLNDEHVKQIIAKEFGSQVFAEDKIDRKKLAQLVFNDKPSLEKLNTIIHPRVAKEFDAWKTNTNSIYGLKEAAILFESGSNKGLDGIIYIAAPQELRIQRVTKRDGVTKQMVIDRINNQWPESKKIGLSDYVINNDESVSLIQQVLQLHKELSDANS